jgi:hypothetical protein
MKLFDGDGGPPVPVHVVRVRHGGDAACWGPSGEARAGGAGVYVESFATDVPDAPDFEVELPMLRAGGTGQAFVGEAQSAPHVGLSWPCDGDGD